MGSTIALMPSTSSDIGSEDTSERGINSVDAKIDRQPPSGETRELSRDINLRKLESPSVIRLLWCDRSPFKNVSILNI